MKYITVTSSNDNTKILINPQYIIAIIESSDSASKSIIHMTRETFHVEESKDQLLTLIG